MPCGHGCSSGAPPSGQVAWGRVRLDPHSRYVWTLCHAPPEKWFPADPSPPGRSDGTSARVDAWVWTPKADRPEIRHIVSASHAPLRSGPIGGQTAGTTTARKTAKIGRTHVL